MEYFVAKFSWLGEVSDEHSPEGSSDFKAAGVYLHWFKDSKLAHFEKLHQFLIFSWGSISDRNQVRSTKEILQNVANRIHNGEDLSDCLAEYEGEFGLIIWDSLKRQLFLISDPIGIVKLYYSQTSHGIVVSSHARWAARQLNQTEISPVGISFLFSIKGIPAPHTLIEGLYTLPPAEIVAISSSETRSKHYWPLDQHLHPYQGSFDQAQDDLLGSLESVLMRMAGGGNKQLGVCLSGGVDSALLAGLVHKLKIPMRAFTVGYNPSTINDETSAAFQNAKAIGIGVDVIRPTDDELAITIDSLVNNMPEPISDATVLPQLALTNFAQNYSNSILDGTGADNIFGSMQKFSAEKLVRQYRKIPGFLREGLISPLLNKLPSSRLNNFTNWARKAQKFSHGAELDEVVRQVYWSRFMPVEMVESLFLPNVKTNGRLADEFLLGLRKEIPEKAGDLIISTIASIRGTLPTHAVQKLMTLEYVTGIRYHLPYVTPGIVELSLSLPDHFKLDGSRSKIILRAAASRILPQVCLTRKKATFSPPIGRWLTGVFKVELLDLLVNNPIFDQNRIESMYFDQVRGWRDWQWELWLVFVVLKWWDLLRK